MLKKERAELEKEREELRRVREEIERKRTGDASFNLEESFTSEEKTIEDSKQMSHRFRIALLPIQI